MKEWVLVMILIGGEGQGSIDHVEFVTKQACEATKREMDNNFGGGFFSYKVWSRCVRVGTKPDGKVEK